VGASYERVLRMVLRQGMTPVGCQYGVERRYGPGAAWVVPLGPHYDSRAYFLILPMLLVVTILAVLAPSRRATLVDPAAALRVDCRG
jgi:ABC-type lipoprotein release transport system permease subunit